MLKGFIKKLSEGFSLSMDEMIEAMDIIMSGKANEAQIAAFLTALKIKEETVDEIAGAAIIMREKAEKIDMDIDLLDTCGTGGDHKNTFNISTAVAIVAAAADIEVAKHGNKALTSRSGSADILSALGVKIDISLEKVKESIEKIKIGFLFAPGCHKAMRYAMPVRKSIGIRTIFNILGPLANPFKNTYHLLGVFSEELIEKIANVLKKLNFKHALVVSGEGGVDEIVMSGYTKVSELKNGDIKNYEIKPEDYGFKRTPIENIKGGPPEENAKILKEVFDNKRQDAYYDTIVLNSGFAIYVSDRVKSPEEGIKMARDIITSGRAKKKLDEFIEFTNKF